MKSAVALGFTLYVTVFAQTSFGSTSQSCQASSVTTTPPIECILPQKPQPYNHLNLVCSVFGETETCGTITLEGFIFNATCKEGYIFERTGPSIYTLHVNGSWTPSIPNCKRCCKPLKASGVDVQCHNNGKEIECSKSVPAGTVATNRCKLGHMPIEEASNTPIVCKENGQWSRELIRCEAVCGKMNSAQGSSLTESVPPWFAVIYRRNTIADTPYQECVGTLISPHLVLTEAYCVYSEEDRRMVSTQKIEVVLRKRFKSWTHDEKEVVKVNVREIAIPPRYSGSVSNYAVNLALIDLETSVVIKSDIMPACFDWGREFDIITGQSGTITIVRQSNKSLSDKPTYVQFEYVDYSSCISELESYLRPYVLPERFCTRFTNRTTKLDFKGFAGSGLMFERNGVYYVKAVMGTWLTLGDQKIITFTNLSDVGMLDWLQRTKRSFDANHNGT